MFGLTRGIALFLFLFLITATLPVLAQVSQPNTSGSGMDAQQPQPEQAPANPALALPTQTRHHGVAWRNPHLPIHFAAPAGAHLTYFGGPVISNVHFVELFYESLAYLPPLTQPPTP